VFDNRKDDDDDAETNRQTNLEPRMGFQDQYRGLFPHAI